MELGKIRSVVLKDDEIITVTDHLTEAEVYIVLERQRVFCSEILLAERQFGHKYITSFVNCYNEQNDLFVSIPIANVRSINYFTKKDLELNELKKKNSRGL